MGSQAFHNQATNRHSHSHTKPTQTMHQFKPSLLGRPIEFTVRGPAGGRVLLDTYWENLFVTCRLTEVTKTSGVVGRTDALKFIRRDGVVWTTDSTIVAVVHNTVTSG